MESLGGMGFFNEATFLLAKNPREAKKLQSKEEWEKCAGTASYPPVQTEKGKKKKKRNVIRFFFCLWLITLNGINIICIHMIFNMKS